MKAKVPMDFKKQLEMAVNLLGALETVVDAADSAEQSGLCTDKKFKKTLAQAKALLGRPQREEPG